MPWFSGNEPDLGIAGIQMGGVLGAGLLLFWLFRRGNSQRRRRNARRVGAPRAVVPARAVKGEKADTPEAMGWTPLDRSTTVVDELGGAEEQAEVFMMLGRADMAIGILRQCVDSHPDAQPQVWMSLLDILYREGRRGEFEILALEIKGRFNVALPTWEETGERNGESIALERFPHLLEKIGKQWNNANCIAYLRGLIHDTREGKRSGFHQEVFRELLLLIGIQEQRAKTVA